MKNRILITCLFLFCFSIKAQNQVQEENNYALLDLGFNAKLLNLASNNPTLVVKENDTVRKSPRSLNEILNKSKKVSKKKEAVKYHLIAGCFSKAQNAKNLAGQLVIQGFNSSILEQTNGMYFVSCESFESYTTALNELNKLVGDGLDTWISKE